LSHLTAEEIKKQNSTYVGAERFLDILLRVGPYGDKFDPRSEGLNLARVKAAQHGMDLGPLRTRLPEALRTESQRLRLVHEVFENDMPRLYAALQRKPADMVLIGRRHIRDMNSWLHNIKHYVRGKNRCTLIINPRDANRLGLTDGAQALVKGRVGEQRVHVTVSDEIMPGVVSLPHGFGHRYAGTRQSIASEKLLGVSANDLVDDDVLDIPSGTSVVNGVPVEVCAV
ncbi:MAG: molybdopterin dinucleotide binding domain-containing protein, partial [Pseudomonadales bacterium]